MTAQTLKRFDVKKASASNRTPDTITGASESVFNSFFSVHHAQNPNLYKGSRQFEHYELTYAWDIAAPISVDFTPIQLDSYVERLESLYKMASKHELFKEFKKDFEQPCCDKTLEDQSPNISLTFPRINFSLALDEDPTNPVVFHVKFKMSCVAEMSGKRVIITPLSAEVTDIGTFEKALKQVIKEQKHLKRLANDEENIKKILMHLVNIFLQDNLTGMVQAIDLPAAIGLVDGINLVDLSARVNSNHLVGEAFITPKNFSICSNDVDSISYEPMKLMGEKLDKTKISIDQTLSDPENPLFILFSKSFFQTFANKYLNRDFTGHVEDSKDVGVGTAKWKFDWFVYLSQPTVSIANDKLILKVTVTAKIRNGNAKLYVWGHPQASCDFSADGEVQGGKVTIESTLYFKDNNSFWVNAKVLPFNPDVKNLNLCWWLRPAKSYIERKLEDEIRKMEQKMKMSWDFRVVNLPEHFPGTQMSYTANFGAVKEYDGNLGLVADLTFQN